MTDQPSESVDPGQSDLPPDFTLLQTNGLDLGLPPGWEAEIDSGSGDAVDGAPSITTPRVHAANFALPADRGDFGSGAVEIMSSGDVLICLLEESPEVIGTGLFNSEGLPVITADEFSPSGMQRPIRGQSGLQRFFHHNGRAFALYIVLGSHLSRTNFIDEINSVLAAITVR